MIAFHTKNTTLLLDQSSRSTNLAQQKKLIDDFVSIQMPINLHTKKVSRFIHLLMQERRRGHPF